MTLKFNEIYDLPTRNIVNVCRYSGKYLIRPESLSHHITDMICLGLQIYEDMKKCNIDIDKKDLIYRIAVHDFDESILCDLPRDFKYYSEKFRSEVEVVVQGVISKSFTPELVQDINSSKDISDNGLIVKTLDIVQATLVLVREVEELGNRTLNDVLDSNLNYLYSWSVKLEDLDTDVSRYLLKYVSEIIRKVKRT